MPDLKMKEVGFDAVEPFARFTTDDGAVIKVKIVMNKIMRVLDDKGQPAFGPDGTPWYDLKMVPHISVEEIGQDERREPTGQPGEVRDLGLAKD